MEPDKDGNFRVGDSDIIIDEPTKWFPGGAWKDKDKARAIEHMFNLARKSGNYIVVATPDFKLLMVYIRNNYYRRFLCKGAHQQEKYKGAAVEFLDKVFVFDQGQRTSESWIANSMDERLNQCYVSTSTTWGYETDASSEEDLTQSAKARRATYMSAVGLFALLGSLGSLLIGMAGHLIWTDLRAARAAGR